MNALDTYMIVGLCFGILALAAGEVRLHRTVKKLKKRHDFNLRMTRLDANAKCPLRDWDLCPNTMQGRKAFMGEIESRREIKS